MKVKDLIAALQKWYPEDAVVLVAEPHPSLNLAPVTEFILDEKRNTIELVAD